MPTIFIPHNNTSYKVNKGNKYLKKTQENKSNEKRKEENVRKCS